MRTLGLALLVVAVSIPRAASAFCRITTTETKIDGADTTACYDTSDPPVWWPGACVGMSAQADGSKKYGIPYAVVDDLLFGTVLPNWMNADCPGQAGGNPSIEVVDVGAAQCDEQQANLYAPNDNIVMFHDDAWPYDECDVTIALTTVTFHPATGAVWDADIEINSACHAISTTLPVPAGSFDLQSILQHETGHYFGLAHPPDPEAVMYYLYLPGEDGKRTLNSDDIRGLCTIYPPSGERSVGAEVADGGFVPEGTCDALPRNGFGSACATDAGDQPPPAQPTALTCAAGGAPGRSGCPWTTTAWTAAVSLGLLLARQGRRTGRADRIGARPRDPCYRGLR